MKIKLFIFSLLILFLTLPVVFPVLSSASETEVFQTVLEDDPGSGGVI